MASSSSSRRSNRCLICILFGLCLILIVALSAVFIYHLNSSDFSRFKTKSTDLCTTYPIARRLQYPDFVNTNIDLCENFHEFVCNRWTKQNQRKFFDDQVDFEDKWTHIQKEIHEKIMSNISDPSILNESMYKTYNKV